MTCKYVRPATLDEAVASLREAAGEATVFAGGVALGILMNEGLLKPSWIVDISRLDALRQIAAASNGGLSIGAAVANAEVLASPDVKRHSSLLHEMADEIACERVRNRGTIGGNLCLADPQGDPPVALLALDAVLRVRGHTGARQIPITEFFEDLYKTALAPGELLEAIDVSAMPPNCGTAYGKYAARRAMDYSSTISAAASVECDPASGAIIRARIGLGGVGPIPLRARAAEAVLNGKKLDHGVLKAASAAQAELLEPLTDTLYSADYKRHVAGVLMQRTLRKAYDRARQTTKGAA
ncbi:MAG: xanthine dehydrogenase family protein subunit M [Alphaproteobacteria bacterium]